MEHLDTVKKFNRSESIKDGDKRILFGSERIYTVNVGWIDKDGDIITHAAACSLDWLNSNTRTISSGWMTYEEVEKMNKAAESFWEEMEKKYNNDHGKP